MVAFLSVFCFLIHCVGVFGFIDHFKDLPEVERLLTNSPASDDVPSTSIPQPGSSEGLLSSLSIITVAAEKVIKLARSNKSQKTTGLVSSLPIFEIEPTTTSNRPSSSLQRSSVASTNHPLVEKREKVVSSAPTVETHWRTQEEAINIIKSSSFSAGDKRKPK